MYPKSRNRVHIAAYGLQPAYGLPRSCYWKGGARAWALLLRRAARALRPATATHRHLTPEPFRPSSAPGPPAPPGLRVPWHARGVVAPFFHMFCGSTCLCIIARLAWALSYPWLSRLFAALRRCPFRAPAACRPAAPAGTPLWGSRYARHSGSRFAPVFVGWRLEPRCVSAGVSPGSQPRQVCPLQPRPECPPLVRHFLSRAGRGDIPRHARGSAPAPHAGGAPPAPLHPLARRRGGRCFSWYLDIPDFAILALIQVAPS